MSITRSFRSKSRSLLGKGSFGTSQTRVENGNFVVVKTMSISPAEFRQEAEMFCQEYDRLANFLKAKSYFVKLHRVCLTTGMGPSRLLCVTEYLKYNLRSFINLEDTDPKIYIEDVAKITKQVAKGLKFLHDPSRGTVIVHRHLSPDNILIKIQEAGKFRAMIADAGLAQTFENSFPATKITANDERYMAPEVFGNICNKRLAKDYSPAVDLFSLGMIVLEMCIGQLPEPLHRHQQVQSDLQKVDDNHPMKELTSSCLRLNPSERITAQDVYQKLKQETFKNAVTRHDFQEMKKIIISHYNNWKAVRAKTIEKLKERNLKDDIEKLNKVHRKVGIVKASTSTAALIGGGVAIGGFIASFFTAGIAIPVMIAGGVVAATGGLFTVGAQTTEKVITKEQLKTIDKEIADDILESQSLRKDFQKFDELFKRNWERYILQDQEKQDDELYGCLQKIFDLQIDFEELISSGDTMAERARAVSLSAFTAASLTTGVVEGARITTAAFQTLSAASRVSHLFGGIMTAITIPIDVYFIYTSLEALRKQSESDAARAIQEMNDKMVINERSTEEIVEDYIQMKMHDLIKERQLLRKEEGAREKESQGNEEKGPEPSTNIEVAAGIEEQQLHIGNSCFYA